MSPSPREPYRSLLAYALVCLVLSAAAPACKKKKPAPSPTLVARFAALKPQGAERPAQIAKPKWSIWEKNAHNGRSVTSSGSFAPNDPL